MKDNRSVPTPRWPTHLVIIILLLLFSFWRLIPLLPQVSTHIPGDIMDSAEYPLNEWWTAHALLDLKTNPFQNLHMFSPLGLNMVQHTYTFLDGLFFSLLRSIFPLIVFHNFIIWFTCFVNAAVAYGLLVTIVRTPWLAFIGALAFGHCPTLTSFYKTASLLEVYTFVLFIFFSVRFIQKKRWIWAFPTGLFWGLSLYNYPYYFVFSGLWLLLLIGYQLWPWELRNNKSSEGNIPTWVPILIRVFLVGLFIFPVVAPRRLWELLMRWNLVNWITLSVIGLLMVLTWMVIKFQTYRKIHLSSSRIPSRGRLHPRGRNPESNFFNSSRAPSFAGMTKFMNDARGSFVTNFPVHWNPPPGREALLLFNFTVVTLGIAALVGFPYFQAYIKEEATRLAVISPVSEFATYSVDLASFFAPFNPWLEGLYQLMAPDWKLGRPIVGTPAFLGYGFMLILFWGMGQFFKRPELRLWLIAWGGFLVLSLGPYLKVHGLINYSLPLPAYLIRYIPVVESARALSRYLVPVMLFLCLLVCLILKPLYVKMSSKGKLFLIGALVFLVGFEYGLFPTPVSLRFSDYRVPEVYNALARKAGNQTGVLLDLPLFTHSGSRSAGHGETRRFYYQTIHQQKIIGGVSSRLDESVFVYFQNQPAISKLWSLQPVDQNELAALIHVFEIQWIVLDKRYYLPENLKAYRSLFDSAPFLKIFHEDSRFLGFIVDQQATVLKEVALRYWGTSKALSGLIYPGFNRSLKSGKPSPLELLVPRKLWNCLEIEIKPETAQTFSGLKLSIPDKKEIDIPFPAGNSRESQKPFQIRPNQIFPLDTGLSSTIRVTLTPGERRPAQTLGKFPFRIALLSLGQASGFHLSPSQALIQDNHFFVDQRGITAFRISEQGQVLEKVSFDTHESTQGTQALTAWLKTFSNREYLAIIVHDDGSRSLTPEVPDLLRTFGAVDPLKKGDWRYSYCLLGKKGLPKEYGFESKTISSPSFIHSPGQAIEISDIRLIFP